MRNGLALAVSRNNANVCYLNNKTFNMKHFRLTFALVEVELSFSLKRFRTYTVEGLKMFYIIFTILKYDIAVYL